MRDLHVSGEHVFFSTEDAYLLARLDGTVRKRWPTRHAYGYAFGHDQLAFIRPHEVEIVALHSLEPELLDGPAECANTLLGFGPSGRLFLYGGREIGLAAFYPEGDLAFALGFDAVADVMFMAFREDGQRVLCGTYNAFRPDLAIIQAEEQWPRVLHKTQRDVCGLVALPGFERAVIVEGNCTGPCDVSLWRLDPLEHERVLYASPEYIAEIFLRGDRLLMTDCADRLITVDLTGGEPIVDDIGSRDIVVTDEGRVLICDGPVLRTPDGEVLWKGEREIAGCAALSDGFLVADWLGEIRRI